VREGKRIEVHGIVQGVGFRPSVYRIAQKHGIAGRVSNDSDGVIIEAFGDREQIDAFVDDLVIDAPPASRVESIETLTIPYRSLAEFSIDVSKASDRRRISIPPDLPTCDDCLEEMSDPRNRRYRYAFTNCTNCGPRYSIVRDIPYDRATTTMRPFQMCVACQSEYDSPLDRRFHAEPNACPDCGPQLAAIRPDGSELHVADPIAFAARALKAGLTVAVKGIGGFHLACDAASPVAVDRLRDRKHREAKPFAVMVSDLAMAETLAQLDDTERLLLASVERPIVLARRRGDAPLAPGVAPDNHLVGLLLPYSPLHHLLLRETGRPLVMTSGNASDEPMVRGTGAALRKLKNIADVFLTHDREIENRVDDSVARVIAQKPLLIRRARGFVPRGITLARPFAQPILACGAHLKNTFCLASGDTAFLGPHIGDLDELETIDDYEQSIARAKRLLGIEPRIVAHDLHPGYASTRYALAQRGVTHIGVQHHHAHIAAVMAEHRLEGPVIGLAWDGTGHGTDSTSWGGEFFLATRASFERIATFRPLPLAGGDVAVRKVWRIALAALDDAGLTIDFPLFDNTRETEVVRRLIASNLNAPRAHGAGRWFDVFGSLFLNRRISRYEGEIAVAWNSIAALDERGGYPFDIDHTITPWQVDMRLVLAAAIRDFREGAAPAKISARFHNTLAHIAKAVIETIEVSTGNLPIALGGGCFQNSLLTEGIVALLGSSRRVYFNQQIPPGDGGIALGQAVVADAIARCDAGVTVEHALVTAGGF
jgi:hydrogenase maturation protein HypF